MNDTAPRTTSSISLVSVKVLFVACCLVLAVSGLFVVKWQGGFLTAEYRLAFVDPEGLPLTDVEMRVEDTRGRTAYDFPVSDFRSDGSMKSGKDGLITFHHVSRGAEFGGSYVRILFLIPVGTMRAPVYYCRFLHNGKEIYQCRFNELDAQVWATMDNDKGLPVHEFAWRWPKYKHNGDQRLETELTDTISFSVYNMTIAKKTGR